MLQAMFNGVSAIQATQQDMDVIGNNIANVETTGFKGSSVNFADQLSQTLAGGSAGNGNVGGTNPIQVGLGTKVGSINMDIQQGTLTATSSPTDMAIQGNGYFMVADPSGSMDFTRDGHFAIDSNGNLVDANTGQFALGWSASNTGVINNSQTISTANHLQVPIGTLTSAAATANVSWSGNLSADDAANATYTRSVKVFDSLGESHNLTLTFTRGSTGGANPQPTNTWTWQVTGDTNSSGNAVADFTAPAGVVNQGTITFGGNGNVTAATGSIQLTPINGATTPQNIAPNFTVMTQLSGPSNAGPQAQDGFATGTLQSFNIDANGVITGIFSNGQSRALGQVALANFPNPAGLQSLGNNEYVTSPNSGAPVVGAANTQGLGGISVGYLESSNVDLGTELTKMIVTQRSFEANTKIVSTVDQMLADLNNMKQG
jgi:flagellar hook protein FlgE